ncbi:putative transcription factor [Aspergillus sp. HF37]|nr:putative transcription factor [Aspergillus sp. HF37]
MPKAGSFPEHVHNEILRVTDATSLPPPSKIQVFADTYFKHLYHIAPVIDRADLLVEEPSILLLQAICLIGSQLRYPRDQSPTLLSESYYLKIKTLIYAKHEHDNFVILKTLCILCFWIITPPVVVSLDSSYHWLGVAVRLAYQMGLHRESSYSKLSNPGATRRIMWFLFVVDKLQAAAFGRPAFLMSQSMDLRPLGLGDFESADTTAEVFIEYTRLNAFLEKIVEFQDRKAEISLEQFRLVEWQHADQKTISR